ncbi:hypothetical protein [Arthrobacter sp. TMS1-12-1]
MQATEADRPLAVARSAAVGLLCVGLGACAHALSGATLPGPLILCGVTALAVLAATLAGRVRLPTWGILLLLGAAQQVLHWLFGGLVVGSVTPAPPAVHHGDGVPVGVGPGQDHSPEIMLMLHTHLAVALLLGWAGVRAPGVRAWFVRRARPRREAPARTTEGAPVA